MIYRRDPKDRRVLERLGIGYIASLLLHALLAILFFAPMLTSSQEGSTENVQGSTMVTLERRAPAAAAQPSAAPKEAAPVPHAPVAPQVHHAQPHPPAKQQPSDRRPELSKFAPTAPPQATPQPLVTVAPAPQPTTAVIETNPKEDQAAVPVSVPTAAAVAVTVKVPPTAAPSPVPTSAPSVAPSPKPPAPTAVPSARPTIAASVAPSALPSTAPAIARATALPTQSAAPGPLSSASPAPKAGAPSPGPKPAPPTIAKAGNAPSPGPKGESSPGPREGARPLASSAPRQPVTVPSTPTPAPQRTPRPTPASNAPDINAKLRGLLPSNAVNPTTKSYGARPDIAAHLEPTPPPAVAAQTKYLLQQPSGDERLMKMWVTSVNGEGLTRTCTGWLVRYPQPLRDHTVGGNIFNTGSQGGTLANGMSGLAPIVEGITTIGCATRNLTPYAQQTPTP